MALKRGDVEISGEDRARLTLASGSDPRGRAEIREIAGEVVRDLEAIGTFDVPDVQHHCLNGKDSPQRERRAMDRIPTTREGALGGGRETAASPLAGMASGRLGERRVSVVPEMPRPLHGQWHVTGGGIALPARLGPVRSGTAAGVAVSSVPSGATPMPRFRPGRTGPAQPSPPASHPPPDPRAGQGPSGVTPGFVAEPPGPSSGASLAGVGRRRSRNPPAPSPSKSYRSYWNAFVDWCEARNAQYWPASPATVADHLRDRSRRCATGTLRTIRTAIAHTHRTAGFADRYAKGVVAETLRELAAAKGDERGRFRNISGRALGAAEVDAIRQAVFVPRRRGIGYEARAVAKRRGQVDLALCSMVLEAGLRCDQVAALQWRDLKTDSNNRPTITIRTGSAEADEVIVIPKRTHDDLLMIVPAGGEAGKWIFGLNTGQIAYRVTKAAEAVGLENRIVGTASRCGAGAATTGGSNSTIRNRSVYWRAFCEWCETQGKVKLPASPETVAEFLREGSEESCRPTIEAKRYAIKYAHIEKGYSDPCATVVVKRALEEIRDLKSGFPPKSLDPESIEAIRSAATKPRYTGRGEESDDVARKRGLVDIALCSVLYAADLTVTQAAALNWGDVEKVGEDNAKLTIKSGAALRCSAVVREITGQAVRDLDAIRGDARPENRVFGLSANTAYRRINDAARVAGVVEPGVSPAAGPSHIARASPSSSSPDSTPDTSA